MALVDYGISSSGNVKTPPARLASYQQSSSTGALYAISTGFFLFSCTPGVEVDFSKVFHRFGPKALETLSKALCQFFVAD
jgi:hypothetical protein